MKPMLDNPAWWALNTHHADFAQGTAQAKRYSKDILYFIATGSAAEEAPGQALEELEPFMQAGEQFYLVGHLPVLPTGWIMESELPCAQMILPEDIMATLANETRDSSITSSKATARNPRTPSNNPSRGPVDAAPEIEALGEADAAEMFQLINSRQPGYYNMDTWRLGSYYGIRQEGRLVAMAGERLRMTGFSELSAICTDADHTGKGYAQALIWHICRIRAQAGVLPFLHVSLSNQRAVKLYEHMGFIHRREISFWRCRKK